MAKQNNNFIYVVIAIVFIWQGGFKGGLQSTVTFEPSTNLQCVDNLPLINYTTDYSDLIAKNINFFSQIQNMEVDGVKGTLLNEDGYINQFEVLAQYGVNQQILNVPDIQWVQNGTKYYRQVEFGGVITDANYIKNIFNNDIGSNAGYNYYLINGPLEYGTIYPDSIADQIGYFSLYNFTEAYVVFSGYENRPAPQGYTYLGSDESGLMIFKTKENLSNSHLTKITGFLYPNYQNTSYAMYLEDGRDYLLMRDPVLVTEIYARQFIQNEVGIVTYNYSQVGFKNITDYKKLYSIDMYSITHDDCLEGSKSVTPIFYVNNHKVYSFPEILISGSSPDGLASNNFYIFCGANAYRDEVNRTYVSTFGANSLDVAEAYLDTFAPCTEKCIDGKTNLEKCANGNYYEKQVCTNGEWVNIPSASCASNTVYVNQTINQTVYVNVTQQPKQWINGVNNNHLMISIIIILAAVAVFGLARKRK